ncbi:hypothetical protein D3C76_1539430 [compost metagenome]
MLPIVSSTDAAGGLVQHQVARRPASLVQLLIDLDAAELTHFMQRIDNDLAIHAHAPLHQQQAHLLAVVAREVGQFGGQGLEHRRVDGHGKTPATLGSTARVGQAALVEGAAGGAALAVGHEAVSLQTRLRPPCLAR